MTAREEVLGRIRTALGATRAPVPAVVRNYRTTDGRPAGELLDLLVDRLEDYKASVLRCAPDAIAETVAAALETGLNPGWRPDDVVVPPGLPQAWRPHGVS